MNQDFVEFLNQHSGWQATNYEQFAGVTVEEFKARYLGENIVDINDLPAGLTHQTEVEWEGAIPSRFNSSEQWPGCVHPIRNQQKCGSCWAFAISEALSDRFCIASNKSVDVILSPQYAVSCDVAQNGCSGGHPTLPWQFLENIGLPTEACVPYQSGDGTVRPKCLEIKGCEDGSAVKKYPAKRGSSVAMNDIAVIQANIMKYGPLKASMKVYEDFKQYKGGIYKHVAGGFLGGHAVKIIGWGVENDINYWVVANSWANTWGENGYFRVGFGEVGIDGTCIAGLPDLDRVRQSEPTIYW